MTGVPPNPAITATAAETSDVSGPTIAAILSDANDVPYCPREAFVEELLIDVVLLQVVVNPEYPSWFLQFKIACTPPAVVKFESEILYFNLKPLGNKFTASPTRELSRVLM